MNQPEKVKVLMLSCNNVHTQHTNNSHKISLSTLKSSPTFCQACAWQKAHAVPNEISFLPSM